jgi:parvulin-like peptidyl-prolyl isomerase
VILCGLAAGCGSGASSAPHEIVAQVGELAVSWEELELYLALNLFAEEGGGPRDAGELNRVKSRLLDALIDEKAFLIEAERRGLKVGDSEIDAHLAAVVEDHAEVPELTLDQRRFMVRQRLMVQKLLEHVAGQLDSPSDAEVDAYLARSRGRLAPRKKVQLRSLRFDSAESAASAAARIRDGRMSFAEAVVTYETDPGQGVLLELSWETLSDELRAALDPLEPGEVTRPVEFHGDTFLFQLESWLDDPAERDEQLVRHARKELELQRRRQASDRLLRRLRESTRIRIHEKRLPFRYVPEPGA